MEKVPAALLGNEAVLAFGDSDFKIVKPGHFVRCGVTKAPIALDRLLYWSAEHQEAYAGPEAVLERLRNVAKTS
jgi:hypothetical protein